MKKPMLGDETEEEIPGVSFAATVYAALSERRFVLGFRDVSGGPLRPLPGRLVTDSRSALGARSARRPRATPFAQQHLTNTLNFMALQIRVGA